MVASTPLIENEPEPAFEQLTHAPAGLEEHRICANIPARKHRYPIPSILVFLFAMAGLISSLLPGGK